MSEVHKFFVVTLESDTWIFGDIMLIGLVRICLYFKFSISLSMQAFKQYNFW